MIEEAADKCHHLVGLSEQYSRFDDGSLTIVRGKNRHAWKKQYLVGQCTGKYDFEKNTVSHPMDYVTTAISRFRVGGSTENDR